MSMQGNDWFCVRVVAGRDAAVVVLAGEMDVAAVASFEAVFQATLMSGPTEVVIDLDAIASIDEAGLEALLRARRDAHRSGTHVSFHPSSARDGYGRVIESARTAGMLLP
jgi:anti-anti-sigma factor